MQVDLEAGLVVACDHHGSLGVHDGRAGKTALDRLEHQLGIHACLLCQSQSLGKSLNVACHDDLVCQLGGVACAYLAAADGGSAHGVQHRLVGVKDLLLAAYHKAQGSVDCLGLAARDGSIQHLHALLLQLGIDFFGSNRVDGRAVDKDCTGLHVGSHAVCAQHHFLDLRRVGQHGDDHITLLSDLLLGGALCTGGLQLLHRSLAAVVHQQVGVARLQQILCHGLTHDAQTNKTDFHNRFLHKIV